MREKKRREKKKKNYYFLLVAGLLVRCVVDPGRHTYTTKTHTIRFPLSFLLLLLLFLPSQGPSSLPPNRAEAVSSNWKSWKRVTKCRLDCCTGLYDHYVISRHDGKSYNIITPIFSPTHHSNVWIGRYVKTERFDRLTYVVSTSLAKISKHTHPHTELSSSASTSRTTVKP